MPIILPYLLTWSAGPFSEIRYGALEFEALPASKVHLRPSALIGARRIQRGKRLRQSPETLIAAGSVFARRGFSLVSHPALKRRARFNPPRCGRRESFQSHSLRHCERRLRASSPGSNHNLLKLSCRYSMAQGQSRTYTRWSVMRFPLKRFMAVILPIGLLWLFVACTSMCLRNCVQISSHTVGCSSVEPLHRVA